MFCWVIDDWQVKTTLSKEHRKNIPSYTYCRSLTSSKMASAVFSICDVVKCHAKTCMINKINNKLGFNQYGCTNIDTGHRSVGLTTSSRNAIKSWTYCCQISRTLLWTKMGKKPQTWRPRWAGPGVKMGGFEWVHCWWDRREPPLKAYCNSEEVGSQSVPR